MEVAHTPLQGAVLPRGRPQQAPRRASGSTPLCLGFVRGCPMPGTYSPCPAPQAPGEMLLSGTPHPLEQLALPGCAPLPEPREAGRWESHYVALGADSGRQGDAPECASPWQLTESSESPGSASGTVVSLMWPGPVEPAPWRSLRAQREGRSPFPHVLRLRRPPQGSANDHPCGQAAQAGGAAP